jgi:pimeloyl-ACP methyl ester carboxylesterase
MISHLLSAKLSFFPSAALGYHDKPFSLIGYDLGGAIAAGFAARFPHLTASLTMIGPIGVLFNGPFDEGSFKTKYFGEYSIHKQRETLPTKQEDDFYAIEDNSSHRYLIDKQVAMSEWQLKNSPGYLGALLSLYRYFPIRDMEEIYYAIGRHTKNVLVIWGGRDKICPYSKCIKFMEKAFPSATIVDITDCGHNCVFEKFEEVVTELLQFHREVYYGKNG